MTSAISFEAVGIHISDKKKPKSRGKSIEQWYQRRVCLGVFESLSLERAYRGLVVDVDQGLSTSQSLGLPCTKLHVKMSG